MKVKLYQIWRDPERVAERYCKVVRAVPNSERVIMQACYADGSLFPRSQKFWVTREGLITKWDLIDDKE